MPWSAGRRLTNLYHINGKAEPLDVMLLERQDVHAIIRENPQVLPYIKSGKCFILEDVPAENNNKVDLVVVEASERRSKPAIYLVFLKWFEYGRLVEDIDSFEEAYSTVGRELESLDEVVASLSTLGSCRRRWARELRKKLKSLLGVKRLVIGDVHALVVVNELTERFIRVIDAVNDLVDTHIDALEITGYRLENCEKIIFTNLYTWRD